MTALVIGVGHPWRGDDAVGPRVAERLAGWSDVVAMAHHGEGADLIERWRGHDRVVVIDAMASGEAPGTIRVWDAVAGALPAHLFPKGSHLFGLAEAVEMARLLGRLPPALTVIGVAGRCFGMGEPLSPEVEQALPAVAARVAACLAAP